MQKTAIANTIKRYNLAAGCNEKLQLGNMVGVFKLAVDMAKKKA